MKNCEKLIKEIEYLNNTPDGKIVDADTISENEIELVMNALSGQPIVTSAKFADKIEKILKRHIQ